VDEEDKVQIKHIQNGGPNISVTSRRVKRILKRRKKRVQFLMENPEYSLPYKFRHRGPKHQSRSKSAKNRKRKSDGRFAKSMMPHFNFSIGMEDSEQFQKDGAEGCEDIVREKL
jgi:hypothetical protein